MEEDGAKTVSSIVGVYSIPVPNYRDPIYGPFEKQVCLGILKSHMETGFHDGSEPYVSLQAIVHCTRADIQALSNHYEDDVMALIMETNRENPEWAKDLEV